MKKENARLDEEPRDGSAKPYPPSPAAPSRPRRQGPPSFNTREECLYV